MSLSKKNLDKLNKFKKKKNLNNESKNINNYLYAPPAICQKYRVKIKKLGLHPPSPLRIHWN